MTSPENLAEQMRLEALLEYGIENPLAEPGFDRIVRLAASIFDVPIALVSLVEAERQLFAVNLGLDVCETSREVSFCAHAIKKNDIMVVPDAQADLRFRNNPLVTNSPFIRFYAGVPLRTRSGQALGTLCIISHQPRKSLSETERRNLRDLAALVQDQLEIRRLEIARRTSQFRFENIADSSPDIIICADNEGRTTFWNAAAEKLLGYPSADILGRSIDLIAPRQFITYLQQIAEAGGLHMQGRTVEMTVRAADGSMIPVELTGSLWRENGCLSFGAILRDLTERRQNEERLLWLAQI